MNFILQLLLLTVGFAMLVKGADFFVDGACWVAEKFRIPKLIIGLTIVAMGTSAPEAAVSLTSAAKGVADITIGNIVGSNIMNILVILGLSAVIVPLNVPKSTVRIEIPFMIVITALLYLVGMDGTVTFFDGIILALCFLLYLGYLFYSARHNPEEAEEEDDKVLKPWQALLGLVGGLGLILWGSDIAVDAATEIARILGMSERLIGLTIVALGTSLPELVTSVTAARKGNADMAIGNIVGSNIFNILFVVGLSAMIIPVPFASAFLVDTLIALAVAVFLLVASLPRRRLNRVSGALMLLGYVAYLLYLL
ncbi:MAG: calcium/sodium antiporter [Oscillospiraceae bacterium]|nr:calcium/sodium antiporter [Oscillospiraceae bacterium]